MHSNYKGLVILVCIIVLFKNYVQGLPKNPDEHIQEGNDPSSSQTRVQELSNTIEENDEIDQSQLLKDKLELSNALTLDQIEVSKKLAE